MIATKPIETRPAWFAFVSHQFRHPSLGGGLRKKDVGAIEYYLRRGEKMLENYKSTGVRSVTIPEGAEEWKQGWVAKGGKEAAVKGTLRRRLGAAAEAEPRQVGLQADRNE